MTIDQKLVEMEKQEQAATPGPWEIRKKQYCVLAHPRQPHTWESGGGVYFSPQDEEIIFGNGDDMGYVDVKPNDLAFIASARTNVPKLLRLVQAQRRVIEAQRDRLNPDIGEYPLVRDVLCETEQDLAAAEKEMVG